MRLLTVLAALAVALASAGCFGGNGDEPPANGTPTGTTPAVSPTPEATPTVETNATPTTPTTEPTPATPTTPAPPAPKVVANQSFDFASEGDPTGTAPKTKATDAVPAGYGNLTVNITFTRTSTGPTTLPVSGSLNTPTIRLIDPNGVEVLSGTEAAPPAPGTVVPAVPGAWTVKYEGSGTVKATVVLTATA